MKKLIAATMVTLPLILTGCGSDDEASVPDIVERAQSDDRFDTLVSAVIQAQLVDTLKGEGPYTVFAPTDEAFATFLNDNELTAEQLLASEDLASILTYHVLAGEVAASQALTMAGSGENTVETVNGAKVSLSLVGDSLYVNGAKVVVTDVTAENGVIHAIDKVLLPPAVAPTQDIVSIAGGDDRFDVLVAALTEANLVTTLQGDGPFTVFAPTDDAFTAYLNEAGISQQDLLDSDALADILTYHVLAGQLVADAAVATAQSNANLVTTVNGDSVALSLSGADLAVNTATVSQADVLATNGVIHVLDQVLLPPANSALSDDTKTIAQIVAGLATGGEGSEFNTLLAAVEAADAAVITALSDVNGELTVFAPTDAAFAELLAELELTAEQLLASEDLTNILLQHVVGAEIPALNAYAANGTDVETLRAGTSVSVAVEGGALTIEGATVAEANVKASNGIIHVIDKVIFSVE